MKRKISGVFFALFLLLLLALFARTRCSWETGSVCPFAAAKLRLGECHIGASFADDERSKTTFNVCISVVNGGKAVDEVVVDIALLDREGKQVAYISDVIEDIREGKEAVSRAGVEVKHPHLWSAETPYLYTVRVELKDKRGKILETKSSSFAFRRNEEEDEGQNHSSSINDLQ